ncbi:hypothetical protein [Desulfospira joergensenii]|uniref:hypothetical protein n=1 Tax=Desulfospira joergensenii TaxID=53329 RepID=UPI0003B45465|nr:hypothetical protein [Desulfospira joergensenii]
MRYIYYIAGIIVIFSGLAVYGLITPRVEISKPAVVINDRIITESELEGLMKTKPYYMTRDEFIDSVITRQLLIQEAVKEEINKEEPFRRSVENYYEQSLIKILLDRKLNSLEVEVGQGEIEKYQKLAGSRVVISKFGYKSVEDAEAGKDQTPQKIESDFVDISDELKYIVLGLDKGESSKPVVSGMGVMVYRLDEIIALEEVSSGIRETDEKHISDFIRDKKREALMEKWTRKLKENAEIWREK